MDLTLEFASRRRRFFADLVDLLIALLLGIPFFGLLGIFYYLFRDAVPFLNGQSWGKQLLGIQAVKQETFESLKGRYGDACLRSIPRCVPLLNLLDAIYVFGEKKHRLGDRWAQTCVIRLAKA